MENWCPITFINRLGPLWRLSMAHHTHPCHMNGRTLLINRAGLTALSGDGNRTLHAVEHVDWHTPIMKHASRVRS